MRSAIFPTREYLAYLDEIGAPVLNGIRVRSSSRRRARARSPARLASAPAHAGRQRRREVAAAAAELRASGARQAEPRRQRRGDPVVRDARRSSREAPSSISASTDGARPGAHSRARTSPRPDRDPRRRVPVRDPPAPAAGQLQPLPRRLLRSAGNRRRCLGRGLPVERLRSAGGARRGREALVAGAGMDLGGVEYVVDARDGEAYFYASTRSRTSSPTLPNVVGFDPFALVAR